MRRSALIALAAVAVLAATVEGTRPGPLLRGTTVIVFRRPHEQSLQQLTTATGVAPQLLDVSVTDVIDRAFDVQLNLMGQPFRFDREPPKDMMNELFGLRRVRRCPRLHRPRAFPLADLDADTLTKQMAAARFGVKAPVLTSAGQDEPNRLLGQTWTIGNPGMPGPNKEVHGIISPVDSDQKPQRQWIFKDSVKRNAERPKTYVWDAPSRRTNEANEPPGGSSLTWSLYKDDGQLNSGVVLFVLLLVACVAVWLRLLAMWCCCALRDHGDYWRRSGGRRRRRCKTRCQLRQLLVGGAAEKGGLQQPLLAPLAPEPACAAEEAAKSATPMTHYVTLQYQPLSSEAR